MNVRLGLLALCLCCILPTYAQHSLGSTGLLTVPTADMPRDGLLRVGGNYLPSESLPHQVWNYNTGNYFVNLTILPFIELTYRCTLLRLNTHKWNQDRSVGVRLRPLKEGRYWPSLVIGSNDVITTGHLNALKEVDGNRYFSSVFGVLTKHWQPGGHDIGLSAGWNFPFRKHALQEGLFCGVSYSPAGFRPLILMAEYDSRIANIGASVLLFSHVTVHAFCYNWRAVSVGLRYELGLKELFGKRGAKR